MERITYINFIKKNSHYFKFTGEIKHLPLSVVKEVLDLLKSDPLTVKNRDFDTVPKGESNHAFFVSPGWREMWQHIFVIDHDVGVAGDGSWTY